MAKKKSPKLNPRRAQALEGVLPGLERLREQQLIYKYILEESVKALRAEGGTLFVIDEGMAALVPKASVGIHLEKLKTLPFKFGVGICGWVAINGEPLLINDVSRDPRFNKLYDKQTGYITKSVLCAPMPLHQNREAVIEIINHAEHNFNRDDLVFLDVLSRHAATALEKAV